MRAAVRNGDHQEFSTCLQHVEKHFTSQFIDIGNGTSVSVGGFIKFESINFSPFVSDSGEIEYRVNIRGQHNLSGRVASALETSYLSFDINYSVEDFNEQFDKNRAAYSGDRLEAIRFSVLKESAEMESLKAQPDQRCHVEEISQELLAEAERVRNQNYQQNHGAVNQEDSMSADVPSFFGEFADQTRGDGKGI